MVGKINYDAPLSQYFNHQYSLEYYLNDNDICPDIIPYANEQGIDINLVCVKRFCRDKHYLITPELKLKPENGWRIICIESCDFFGKNISVSDDNCIVQHDRLRISVSHKYTLDNLLKLLYEKFGYNKGYGYDNSYSTIKPLINSEYFCTKAYDKDIDPRRIKTVRFIRNGTSFDQAIQYAEHVIFSYEFSRPFTYYDFKTAKHLKKITLGQTYNQIIDPQFLPPTLEELVLGANYNQVLHSMPIKKLVLNDNYDKEIVCFFPNLEHLVIGEKYNKPLPADLLPNLKTTVIAKKPPTYESFYA